MTHNRLTKLAMVGAVALALGFPISNAQAQTTQNVAIDFEVNSGFVVGAATLNFGTIGFTLDGTNDARFDIATNGTATASSAGGTTTAFYIVDAVPASLTVQGPVATDIDMVIPSAGIVDLTDGVGANDLILTDFVYNDQATVPNSGTVALDTPVTVTLDAINTDETVLIGARISAEGAGTYANATYNGSFDVTFQY